MKLAIGLFVLLLGCGDDGASSDASVADGGTDTTSDGTLVDGGMCDPVDQVCPGFPPLFGAACAGDLSCEYSVTEGEPSTFMCVDGAWQSDELCAGCAPTLVERCESPFAGSAPAEIEIGAADGAFVPFFETARVLPEFGGQGAMVALRVQLDSAANDACYSVRVTTRLEGVEAPPAEYPVRFRCGQTQRVLAILADNPCEFRDYDVELDVEVVGVGTKSVTVVLEGGSCPRNLPG